MKNFLKNIFPLSLFLILILFSSQTVCAQWSVEDLSIFNLPEAPVSAIIGGIFIWIFRILFFISLIGFIIAGLLYLTAAGDEDRISKAKKALTYSIIGVIVGLSGFVIIQAVSYMLSGSYSF
jgi:uncharacterized membrane protein YjjP (DUF1212 family)